MWSELEKEHQVLHACLEQQLLVNASFHTAPKGRRSLHLRDEAQLQGGLFAQGTCPVRDVSGVLAQERFFHYTLMTLLLCSSCPLTAREPSLSISWFPFPKKQNLRHGLRTVVGFLRA